MDPHGILKEEEKKKPKLTSMTFVCIGPLRDRFVLITVTQLDRNHSVKKFCPKIKPKVLLIEPRSNRMRSSTQ